MNQDIPVRIFDIVGGPLCTSSDDGQLVYDRIAPLLRGGQRVALSFARIDTVISAFLNAAIGQLYGEFKDDEIRERLAIRDMAPEDLVLLKRVVENAKAYFKDPKRFTQAIGEENA
jgi:hypothetical protein